MVKFQFKFKPDVTASRRRAVDPTIEPDGQLSTDPGNSSVSISTASDVHLNHNDSAFTDRLKEVLRLGLAWDHGQCPTKPDLQCRLTRFEMELAEASV